MTNLSIKNNGTQASLGLGTLEQVKFNADGSVEIPNLPAKLGTANAFGAGQTWQNVTSSRAIGVTYTNTTGKPIMVVAAPASTAIANPFIAITQGGVTVGVLGSNQYNTGLPAAVCAIIPDGASYLVNMSGGTVSLAANTWAELR